LDFVNFGKNNEANSASSQTDFQALKESRLEGTRVDPIQAVLPETYISEPQLRITFYRRLATTSDLDALHEIAEDLQDRFKKYPTEVKALLLTTEIRCLAEARGIMRVETQGNRLLLRLSKGSTDEYIRSGKRFPRLTSKQALSRLKEIVQYIKRIKP
jgi:transcription-repair coupling factor (superfamily II helicase)